MANCYESPSQDRMKKIAEGITGTFLQDYSKLLDQIKNDISSAGVSLNPTTANMVNAAILAQSYTQVGDIVKEVPSLVPKLMELNNICRFVRQLNVLPGTSGKPNNSIKLPEFKV